MSTQFRFWVRISLFNFLIVASLGVVLRYKIVFSLPFIDQKHLLHAHSHFAFAGWVSQLLISLLVYYLFTFDKNAFSKYRYLLIANLVTSYGMLACFAWEGYGPLSISFSTLSIFVSYWFAVRYWKDLDRLQLKSPVHLWFKAANVFSVLSSFGAFTLAFMMANKTVHQNWYLAAIYFFLHFQYNGWFFFACGGLITWLLLKQQVQITRLHTIFWLFALSCVPAYFLSALWLPIPVAMYIAVIVAAILQVVAWVWFLLRANTALQLLNSRIPAAAKWLLKLSGIAFSIKLLLQLVSVLPALSTLAFGFRPVVIGYLHLVLLAVISLCLLGCCLALGAIKINRQLLAGITLLVAGIILNELVLMIQGMAAMYYYYIPYLNEILLGAAATIFISLFLVNTSQKKAELSACSH